MTDITAQLQEQVLIARTTEQPLNIVGANTKSGLGRISKGQTLSVREHQGVISYSPSELVIRVRAGTTISCINHVLAEQNQRLIFEPPVFNEQATMGGTLAANQSGPCRPWFGGVRDSVLGLGLINGLGEHMQFGGQVMKNVAGFDVSRSQVGAMGTLGVITDVSLKVLPAFESEVTMALNCPVHEALHLMPRYFREHLPVTGVSFWQGQLLVRLQGSQAGVDSAMKSIPGEPMEPLLATQWWHKLRECQVFESSQSQVLWRHNLGATDQQDMCHDDCLLNWGGAQRWQLLPEGEEATNGAIRYLGGSREAEVNGPVNSVARKLQGKLKMAFDPQSIFNPGRFKLVG